MISTNTIEIFQKLNGDIDFASKAHLETNTEEWDELEKLIARLKIVNSGFASQSFKEETNKLLGSHKDDIIEAIKKLSWMNV